MDAIFHNLSAEEYAKLKDAIPQITILIAGADGKISEDETSWAEKVTGIRTYSAAEDHQEFYREIGETFQARLDQLIKALPQEVGTRNAQLSTMLSDLNGVLHKLEPKNAARMYTELRSFADHVARSSGGFLKFWSVSAEEKKWVELPMIEKFEWKDEEES